jgi:Rps23 Pro-64 3,4-dihydroxylase Tpa1-like proline 4-hydroxylase
MPLLIQGYGARLAVDAEIDVSAALRDLLPSQVSFDHVERAEPVDVRFAVAALESDGFRILRDGVSVDRVCTEGDLRNNLRTRIELALAVFARAGTFIHAGVVGWRDTGILVPGGSHSGKSTLVAELLRLGAVYYSDEYAIVDGEGFVHPYARPISLRAGDTLRPPPGHDPLAVGLIVAGAYHPGTTWAPMLFTGARAVLPILDNVVVLRARPRVGLEIAARLAPRVVTLQGPRPDAREVAPSILAFLDELLDGGRARLTSIRRPTPSRLSAPHGAAVNSEAGGLRRVAYVRVEDVLQPEEHRRLLDYALSHESEFNQSGVYNPDYTHSVDPNHRRSRTFFDPDAIWDLFEQRLNRLLPHVCRDLGIPWFPPDTIERQLHVHCQGDFFGKHADNAHGDVAARRVTSVYYFFETPKRFEGGELCLYDAVDCDGRTDAAPSCTVIEPLDNSLIFFRSDAMHEVRPVRQTAQDFGASRFTLTFWFRAADQGLPDWRGNATSEGDGAIQDRARPVSSASESEDHSDPKGSGP